MGLIPKIPADVVNPYLNVRVLQENTLPKVGQSTKPPLYPHYVAVGGGGTTTYTYTCPERTRAEILFIDLRANYGATNLNQSIGLKFNYGPATIYFIECQYEYSATIPYIFLWTNFYQGASYGSWVRQSFQAVNYEKIKPIPAMIFNPGDSLEVTFTNPQVGENMEAYFGIQEYDIVG